FVISHMLGNLKAFGGATAIDQYALMLRQIGADVLGQGTFLWIARVVLLGAIVMHVTTIIQLLGRNAAGRPTRTVRRRNAATLSAAWMAISGTLILVFVVLHLAQFTFGWITPHAADTSAFEHGAVYSNLWGAFNIWWIAAFYVLMMAMVSLHVYHGAWSMCQTLGLDNPARNGLFRAGSALIAIVLFVGFSAVPVSMLTNAIGPPDTGTTPAAVTTAAMPLEEATTR
ncbi:MAG: succinate dehydrogenase cytochrome b subunit, partial [Phycisphaerales bacterium]|nr:succinate dehydrogenase cytochrome b subunit [Phycisphaerales bacterium]